MDEDPVKKMKGNIFKKLATVVEEKKVEASKFLDPQTSKFPYTDLNNQFPQGVDPARKEQYLSDAEFQSILGTTPDKFALLKGWKQKELKEKKGLF